MGDRTTKTVAIFDRPFKLPGFDETLPSVEWDFETKFASQPDHMDLKAWKASVVVQLHKGEFHPGPTRSLSMSLVNLEHARTKHKLSGQDLSQIFFEDMLTDLILQRVMQADGVSEAQLRHLFSRSRKPPSDIEPIDRIDWPHDIARNAIALFARKLDMLLHPIPLNRGPRARLIGSATDKGFQPAAYGNRRRKSAKVSSPTLESCTYSESPQLRAAPQQ
jgi:hypothetical protein